MMVGTKAIATLSTGYLNALEYAKERVQGPDLAAFTDKTAPRVTITHHPDVRRSLMTQKAYAEGMRALVLYTATVQDEILVKEAAGEDATRREPPQRPAAADRQGLRLGEVLRAAGAVAADLRWLRLPPGVPDRAVHPGLQDRHPLRGHHRDPGPGLLLPEDRPRPGPGPDRALRRDQEVPRRRRRRRGAGAGPRRTGQGRRRPGGHRRRHADRPRGDREGRQVHLQGRPEHHPPAAGLRRRRHRLPPAQGRGGGRTRSWPAPPRRTSPSTPARSPRRSSSPTTSCRASPSSAVWPSPSTSP